MVRPGMLTRLDRRRSTDDKDLARRADWIRLRTLQLIQQAGIGHYSSTLSCAEIFAVLYYHTLRLDPAEPHWPERDRFLLGKGHVVTGVWPVLADLGYFGPELLDDFAKLGAALADHPNMRTAPGIDFSSGSLGHNLSVGVGMALAGRLAGSDHRVFVLLGDGEIHEGQVWEAAMAAGHHELENLVAIVDANGFCASGPTSEVMSIEPIAARFAAFGWRAEDVDGNDATAVREAFDALPAGNRGQPTCVIARTTKGKGVTLMERDPARWHFGALDDQQYAEAVAEIEARLQ